MDYTNLNVNGTHKGTFEGNITGNVTGNILKGTALTAVDLTSDVTLVAGTTASVSRIEVTTGSATKCIIIPTGLIGKIYTVVNNDTDTAVLIKVAGGTAITIAASKTALVQVNGAGTEATRLTADV